MRALTNTPFTLAGSAPGAVLLVHGLGGGVYEVQWLAEHLHARLGLTVRAMHLAGHERPSRLMPPSTHDAWLASLRREYDALAAAHRVVHVVGFSTGCLVVLRLAQQHAVSGKLVLLAPFLAVFKPALLPWRPEALLRAFRFLSQVPRRPPPAPPSRRVGRKTSRSTGWFPTRARWLPPRSDESRLRGISSARDTPGRANTRSEN